MRPTDPLIAALIQRRRDLGLSHQQLAERIGITRPAITRLENGTRSPTLHVLTRHARALGMRLEAVLDIAGTEPR